MFQLSGVHYNTPNHSQAIVEPHGSRENPLDDSQGPFLRGPREDVDPQV